MDQSTSSPVPALASVDAPLIAVAGTRVEIANLLDDAWRNRRVDEEAVEAVLASLQPMHRVETACAQLLMSWLDDRQGRFDRALLLAESALDVFNDVSNSGIWRARALLRVGGAYSRQAMPGRAIENYMLAAREGQRGGDRELAFAAQLNVGVQQRRIDAHELALDSLELAERLADATPDGMAFVVVNRARTLHDLGRHEDGVRCLQESTHHWETFDEGPMPIFGRAVLTRCWAALGRYSDARRCVTEVEEMLETRKEIDRSIVRSEFTLLEARIALGTGNPEAAAELLAEFYRQPDTLYELEAMILASQVAEALGDFRRALELHRQASAMRNEKLCIGHFRMSEALVARTAEQLDELTNVNSQLSGEVDELQRINRQVVELSVRDQLTGIGNRRHFEVETTQALRHRATDEAMSLLVIDIDRFKQINDRFLHSTGDEVLRRIGRILSGVCRDADALCRIGGDEFAVVSPGIRSAEAQGLADRIRDAVEHDDWSGLDETLQVTVSIGVAEAEPGDTPDAVLARADAAMYKLKRARSA